MSRIAIIASSIHPVKQEHLLNWYEDLSATEIKCRLFVGKDSSQIPNAVNYKITSRNEIIRYFLKGKRPAKIQPLLDYNPDIIHLLTSNTFSYVSSIIKNSRVKLIVSFRGYDINVFPFLSSDNLKITQEIFNTANSLHFISRDLMTAAIGLGADPDKCRVIYRSVNVELNNQSETKRNQTDGESAPVKIISVGRLVWQKGYLYALEALAMVKSRGYKFQYQIAGDGVDNDMLRFHVKRLGIQEDVIFLGLVPRTKINNLLEECDIYFQPSVSEALSNSILEASAVGLPIVSSNTGGIPEVVEHNVSGLLTEACNAEGYAESIEKLIVNKRLRTEMAMNARQIIMDRFSRSNEIDSWLNLYNSLS